MNMTGAVKHVDKALDVGVDIIRAQGGEGGGHTVDIAISILLPKVVDTVRGRRSPVIGDVLIVWAGGLFDGRGLAMAPVSEEAGACPMGNNRIVSSGYDDTMRTTIYTGCPIGIFKPVTRLIMRRIGLKSWRRCRPLVCLLSSKMSRKNLAGVWPVWAFPTLQTSLQQMKSRGLWNCL